MQIANSLFLDAASVGGQEEARLIEFYSSVVKMAVCGNHLTHDRGQLKTGGPPVYRLTGMHKHHTLTYFKLVIGSQCGHHSLTLFYPSCFLAMYQQCTY